MSRAARLYAVALSVWCPYCAAPSGHKCYIVEPKSTVGPAISSRPHQIRLDRARKRQ